MNTPAYSHSPETGLEKYDERTQKVVELAMRLMRFDSVSMPVEAANFQSIFAVHNFIRTWCIDNGLRVIEMQPDVEHLFPQLAITFTGNTLNAREQVALVGHYDVVPAQSEEQFEPRIEGDMLWGRASADMKTVVASYMIWMAEQQAKDCKAPFIVMLSGCEENGGVRPWNMKHAIEMLRNNHGVNFGFAVVGERTGEMDASKPGYKPELADIADSNRGWRWYETTGGASGMKVLEAFADAVTQGRKIIADLNADLTSALMYDQSNWRSGFVNSFARTGSDEDTASKMGGHKVRIERQGVSMHSAAVKPNEVTFLEQAIVIVREIRKKLGDDRVALLKLEVGQKGNFNSVTSGGVIELVIDADAEEITQTLASIDERSDISVSQNGFYLGAPCDVSTAFGLDIREIPEHTENVNDVLRVIRLSLEQSGLCFRTVNDGDGWTVDDSIEHLHFLLDAWEDQAERIHTATGKLHGNDGRFFDGKAVIWGQTGIGPHAKNEAHFVGSIAPYLKVLDGFVAKYSL